MAARTRTAWHCSACSGSTLKWAGQCPACKQWDTLVEGPAASPGAAPAGRKASGAGTYVTSPAQRVREIDLAQARRTSTGIAELDRVLGGGLVPGAVVLLAGEPGIGKALALDTPLPTPDGWTTMGRVQTGDLLIGADGKPASVVATTDVLTGRRCYEVVFSDGERITADAQHQWVTSTRSDRLRRRPATVRTTEQIAEKVRIGTDGRTNHAVQTAKPLDLPDASLLVPPYTLGAWLGDGTTGSAAITTEDPEILLAIENEGVQTRPTAGNLRHRLFMDHEPRPPATDCPGCGQKACGAACGQSASARATEIPAALCDGCAKGLAGPAGSGDPCKRCSAATTFQGMLRTVGVLGGKHIPQAYLRASQSQRRELLAGLLDTEGWVNKQGCVQVGFTSKRLADDTHELIASLGYKPSRRTKKVKGRTPESSVFYVSTFTTADKVFRLTRKLADLVGGARSTNDLRYVVSCDRVESVPVRCVQVDNADRTYLASRAMIPTHNSTILLKTAQMVAQRGPVLYVSGEESRAQIRLRAERTGADAHDLWVADESDLGAVIAHVEQRDPVLLIVDSVQAIASSDVDGTIGGVSQVKEVASALTRLAKQRGMPTILVGQATKDGNVAGPRILEHTVDTVCWFEGEQHSPLRMIRTIKNRFGSADEVACFQMTGEGIEEVPDPSGLFLTARDKPVEGTCVTIVMEGKRAMPAEVQALVTPSPMPQPRRGVSGMDKNRMDMIMAVVQKHGRMKFYERDVYLASVGGQRVSEPAADLAAALALASAYDEVPIPPGVVAMGEVALSGDIRPVTGLARRLDEAHRLGFDRALVPPGEQTEQYRKRNPRGISVVHVADVARALQAVHSFAGR